jgi:hypothetical protein
MVKNFVERELHDKLTISDENNKVTFMSSIASGFEGSGSVPVI